MKVNSIETLPVVLTTRQAAAALNRAPHTLRKWACFENGPVRPLRINGRLAWKLEDISRLLEEGSNTSSVPTNRRKRG